MSGYPGQSWPFASSETFCHNRGRCRTPNGPATPKLMREKKIWLTRHCRARHQPFQIVTHTSAIGYWLSPFGVSRTVSDPTNEEFCQRKLRVAGRNESGARANPEARAKGATIYNASVGTVLLHLMRRFRQKFISGDTVLVLPADNLCFRKIVSEFGYQLGLRHQFEPDRTGVAGNLRRQLSGSINLDPAYSKIG